MVTAYRGDIILMEDWLQRLGDRHEPIAVQDAGRATDSLSKDVVAEQWRSAKKRLVVVDLE